MYDRKELYTKIVDKYLVKDYVSNIIGKEYIIPTIGVYDKVKEIDINRLPNSFVLKCNHDSEGLIICKNKNELDKKSLNKLSKALKSNFYYVGREYPYKNVKRKIIAEPYLEDKDKKELRDYKFLCFDGKPKLMYVASGRSNHKTCFDFFDMDFNRINLKQHYPNSDYCDEELKPLNFELMKTLASKLSKDFKHIRVDFYEVDNHVYFGEMTFYHMSGFSKFDPEEYDLELGECLKLD